MEERRLLRSGCFIEPESESQASKSTSKRKNSFKNLTNLKSPKNELCSKELKKEQSNRVTNRLVICIGNQSEGHLAMGADKNHQIRNGTAISSEPSSSVPAEDTTESHHQNETISEETREELVQLMISIKKHLERNYKNVCQRFQLPVQVPSSDISNFTEASSESRYLAKCFLSDDRSVQFVTFVRNSVARKEFLGPDIIRSILEQILRTPSNFIDSGMPMSSNQILVDLHSLYTDILKTCPTHHFRTAYIAVLTTPVKISGIPLSLSEGGILLAVLGLLGYLIQDQNDRNDGDLALRDEEKLNFYDWDAQVEKMNSFETLKRSEKFDRVFLIVDLITRLLETDLANSLMRNPKLLHSMITDPEICPLISYFLWQCHESVVCLNSTIKNVISLFVTIVALNYPKRNIKVLARLLNVICQILNLYEYSDDPREYPVYSNYSLDLVNEIQRCVNNSDYHSVDLIVNVIKNISSPLIQIHLTKNILQKVNDIDRLSLDVPYSLIKSKEFLKFNSFVPTQKDSDEVYPRYNSRSTTTTRTSSLKSREPVQREMTRESYLEILRLYAVAVNKFYCIQTGYVDFKNAKIPKKEKVTSSSPQVFDLSDFEQRLKEIDLNEEISLRQVDLTIDTTVKFFFSKQTFEFYHSEIRNLFKLVKLIKKCHEKFGAVFEPWLETVKEMEIGI